MTSNDRFSLISCSIRMSLPVMPWPNRSSGSCANAAAPHWGIGYPKLDRLR